MPEKLNFDLIVRYADTWTEILAAVRYGRAQNSQLLFWGRLFCLSAAVQPQINPLEPL